MKLSKASDYGLQGVILLAKQPPGTVMLLSEIAFRAGLPRHFLAKIFQQLTQHGVVRSYRGRQRGYALARRLEEINLREIFEAIEGPDIFERCIFWNGRCAEINPCPLHEHWQKLNHTLFKEIMGRTTLAGLFQEQGAG